MWKRRPRWVASAFTATLPLCDTSATWPGSRGRSASPQSAARECMATMPLPLGPHTGSSCRAAAATSAGLERDPRRHLGEPGAEHHRAAAADGAGLLDRLRDGRRGDRHHDGVDRRGQVRERRHARAARRRTCAPGLTPQTSPGKPIVSRLSSVCPP